MLIRISAIQFIEETKLVERCRLVKQENRPTDSFRVLQLMLPKGTSLPLAEFSDFWNLLLQDESDGLQMSICALKYHDLWSAGEQGTPIISTKLLSSAQREAVRAMRDLDCLLIQSDLVESSKAEIVRNLNKILNCSVVLVRPMELLKTLELKRFFDTSVALLQRFDLVDHILNQCELHKGLLKEFLRLAFSAFRQGQKKQLREFSLWIQPYESKICSIDFAIYRECLEEFTEHLIGEGLFESVIKSVAFSQNQTNIMLSWLQLNQAKLEAAFLLVLKENEQALQRAGSLGIQKKVPKGQQNFDQKLDQVGDRHLDESCMSTYDCQELDCNLGEFFFGETGHKDFRMEGVSE